MKTFDATKLKPTTARQVLVQLLQREPELKSLAARLAREAADNPGPADLAEEIEESLNSVSPGDVHLNSGRRYGCYKEPEEAAADLLCEAMNPHFERLEKLLRQGKDAQAMVVCQAIITALYRYHEGDVFEELKAVASDYPEESADWASCLWRTAGNVKDAAQRRFNLDRTLPASFVNEHAPTWQWLLDK